MNICYLLSLDNEQCLCHFDKIKKKQKNATANAIRFLFLMCANGIRACHKFKNNFIIIPRLTCNE